MIKKILSVVWKVLLALVLLVVIVLLGFKAYDAIRHNSFYSNSEAVLKTPGANEGFVPQGFDYIAEGEIFLATGYMSNDMPSRVYVMRKDGTTTYTELKKKDGSDYLGHTGGIAHFGDYIYITGSKGLDVFSYSDILEGKESTNMIGTVLTYNDPAHCYVHNGYILAGSFFIEEDYETPEHERVKTPSGDDNTSVITAFKLDESFDLGIDPAPRAVISTRRCVQGMCITDDGKIVLSTSYGLSTSQLFVYDASKLVSEESYDFKGTTKGGIEFEFCGIPRYYLDSSNLVEVIEAPPMSEELVYLDGKIYIMNESACNKYIFGKITTGYNIFAYNYKK